MYMLGNSDEVAEFDRARKSVKKYPQDKLFLDTCTTKLAVLQTRLSKKKWELEKILKIEKIIILFKKITCQLTMIFQQIQ